MNGQELVECSGGSTSPSCTSGGTHSTSPETYNRIQHDTGADTWHVWGKDGTRTTVTPILNVPTLGTLRWGQTSTTDTLGNTVAYTWACPDADCQPETISYNGFEIEFFREPRPDVGSFGALGSMGELKDRLGSILVRLATGTPIRAYELSYTTSSVTDRSLLSSVQMYGRDVAIDALGEITGGTALPAQTFSYEGDALAGSFQAAGAPATTPPDTTGPVVWFNTRNSSATGYTLRKAGGAQWTGGGNSTRALVSGDGWVEWTVRSPPGGGNAHAVIGLSNGDTDALPSDVDFGIYAPSYLLVAENGIYTHYPSQLVSPGDVLRVEIEGGVVHYKRNGVTVHTTSSKPINYPLRVDASIQFDGHFVDDAEIHGTLVQIGPPCGEAMQLFGDFDGDGRTDRLCTLGTGAEVSLGNGAGFESPQVWSTTLLPGPSSLATVILADFNGDGRTDLADRVAWTGDFLVSLSTGSSFEDWATWGNASGVYGQAYACRMSAAFTGAGDFDGNGLKDVYCQLKNGNNQMFIGLSTGSSFQFSIWNELGCGNYSTRVGAIDFDGNGMDDWYCVSDSGGLSVYPNTGYTFMAPAFGSLGTFCTAGGFVFGDLNADATADVACLTNGKVALSSGRHFFYQGEFGAVCPGSNNGMAADVDGDGASELICNNTGAGANDIEVRDWVNGTLAPAETWASNWCSGTLSSGDFDGDGKPDVYCDSAAAPVGLNGSSGVMPDLATSIQNGLGGTTTVEYTPSTAFDNTNNPPVKQTITTATVDDGRGGLATTTYEYADGYFDRKERRFMGFGYVKRTLPCLAGEAPCPYVETWLAQDLASAGKPEKVVRRDGNGHVLTILDYEYTTNGASVPRTSLLTGEWVTTLDGTGATCASWPCASGKRTYVSHQYDGYGNRTQTLTHGDMDASGDEVLTSWTYQPNTSDYVVNRAASREIRDGATSELLERSERLYDGATSHSQPPTKGQLTTARQLLVEEGRYVERAFAYDAFGNVTSSIDETNRTVTVGYDSTYNTFPISFTDPAGETVSTLWDASCAAPTEVTDVNGQISSLQYDPLCRRTRIDRPLGGYESVSYLDFGNPNGQRVHVESPPAASGGGNLYRTDFFDGFGRTFCTDSRGPSPTQVIRDCREFNARGGLAWETAPFYSGDEPDTTFYQYDGFDRLVRVVLPDANDVETTYDLWARTTTDPHGHLSTTQFDAYGRVVLQEKEGVETESTYDRLGRLVGMTDAAGNEWSWTFDSLGRMTEKNDPDAGIWSYEFDDAGRVTAQADAKGIRTEITYDVAGRPATKTVLGTPAEVVTFGYGEGSGYFNVGRLTSVQAADSTLSFDYDAVGRAVRQTSLIDGVTYVAERRYDEAGLLRGITYPDGDAVGTPADPLVYDPAGRLKTIPGITSNVTYDAAGRPTVQTNLNGTTTTRTYSDRGFLTDIDTTGPAGLLQDLSYSFDAAGMVTQVTSPFPEESWTYGYDSFHRLTSALNVSAPAESQTFQYDVIGRITYNSRIGTYGYPAAGAARPHAPVQAGPYALTYDANGNLESSPLVTLSWGADNQLDQVGATQFAYDGLGSRIKKETAGGSTSLYPMGDDFEITDGVVTKYVAASALGIVAKRVGSTTYWHHTDRQGSIQATTDATGSEVQRRTYRPYGETITESGTESRGWIDQRLDPETGLTYLHARYYSSPLGIFVSPDPLHPARAGVGTNRYAYAAGNPVNRTDRNGLYWCHGEGEPPRWCEDVGVIVNPDDPSDVRYEYSDPVRDEWLRQQGNEGFERPTIERNAQREGRVRDNRERRLAEKEEEQSGEAPVDSPSCVPACGPAPQPEDRPKGDGSLNDPIATDDPTPWKGDPNTLVLRDPESGQYHVYTNVEVLGTALPFGPNGAASIAGALSRGGSSLLRLFGPSGRLFGDTAFGATRQGFFNVGRLNGWVPRLGFTRYGGGAQFRVGVRGWKVDIGRPVRGLGGPD